MAKNKPINPFYVALLPVGVLFALTACAYTVVMVRGLQPGAPSESHFANLMNQHGLTVVIVELLVLGVFTISAIATDDYWTRRFERGQQPRPAEGDTP